MSGARPPAGGGSAGGALIGYSVIAGGVGACAWLWWNEAGAAWWEGPGGATVRFGALAIAAGLVTAVAGMVGYRIAGGGVARRRQRRAEHATAAAKAPAERVDTLELPDGGLEVSVYLGQDQGFTETQEARLVREMGDRFRRDFTVERRTHEKKPRLVLTAPGEAPAVDLPTLVEHPGLSVFEGLDSSIIPFGVRAGGGLAVWDVNVSPHALIVGETGGGKTSTTVTFVCGAILQGWRPDAVDPKRIGLLDLRGIPGMGEIATNAESMAALIGTYRAEMDDRYARIEAGELAKSAVFGMRRLLIVEELTELVEVLTAWWAENKPANDKRRVPPPLSDLWSLLRLGREAGMHVLLVTQRPDVGESMPGSARANTRFRVSVGRLDPQGAQMTWGKDGDAQALAMAVDPEVKGRGVCWGRDGSEPVQVWWTDPADRADLAPSH